MSRTSRSDVLQRIRATRRTVAPDRAMLAAEVAIRSLGINPDRARSAVREPDACLARAILAGVLYRMSLVSLRQVGRYMKCGKATAQARLMRFERLGQRDEILAAARAALAKMPA